jgi:glycosyltransferase involved in cell wall biosynthesis
MNSGKPLPRKIVYLELLDSLLYLEGGSSRVLYRLRRDFPWALNEEWAVERWGLRPSRKRALHEGIRLRGWTLPFRAFPRVLLPVLVWGTQFVLVLLRPRAGIMVAYTPLMGVGAAAARLLRPSAVLVVRIIESGSSRASLLYGRRTEARVLKALERFVLRRATLVLPMSSFTHQMAREAKVPEQRIVVLPNPTRWLGTEVVSLGDTTPARRIVCAGRLVPEKGFDVLLRAFAEVHAEFPDAILEIAGDGSERVELERLARFLNVGTAVRFHGWIPAGRMPEFWGGSLVSVLPSRVEEGLPTALVEAGLSGCALVGTDLGGIRDIIEPGRTGILVPPNDPPALAEALRTLFKDPEEARRLGAEAHDRALRRIEDRDSALGAIHERVELLRRDGRLKSLQPRVPKAAP